MSLEQLNFQLFSLINAGTNTSAFTVKLATFIADDVLYIIPLFLIVYWLFGNNSEKKLALKSVCIALLALGFAQIIVQVYPHPRPFMIHVGRTLIPHTIDPSFPSDHMTLFSAIAMTFLLAKRYWIGGIILLLGCMVAWSRVYLGVHFPFDMVGAVLVSLFTVISFEGIWQRFGNHFSEFFIKIYYRLLALIGIPSNQILINTQED